MTDTTDTAPTPAPAEWNDRSKPTPKGKWIWASDGKTAWLLRGDGEVFPCSATLCLFWTEAIIPVLPNGTIAVVEGDD